MFWNNDSTPPHSRTPNDLADAISVLEGALDTVLAGIARADEMNADEDGQPSTSEGWGALEIAFTDPPVVAEGERAGIVPGGHWDGDGLHLPLPGGSWKAQTLYTRMGGGKWRPAFHLQTQYDISAAVAFLAPIVEKAGWSADPFDQLIAWGVDTAAVQAKDHVESAFVLLAKLRRHHGLQGRNFFGVAAPSPLATDEQGQKYPADHYKAKYGIPTDRLDAARRDGRITGAEKIGGRWYYPFAEVARLWPQDISQEPR